MQILLEAKSDVFTFWEAKNEVMSHAEKLSIKSGWTIIKIGNHCLPHRSDSYPTTNLIKYIQREATDSINGFVDFHFI